jgi:hypothetical protein
MKINDEQKLNLPSLSSASMNGPSFSEKKYVLSLYYFAKATGYVIVGILI